eukprot:Anaeramoba_ignava/a3801_34.p1 GENE.a3801_34~~a3801_34.p1  ORF type:complete len:555 (-),score=98.93 a3801_34:46-1656(-)
MKSDIWVWGENRGLPLPKIKPDQKIDLQTPFHSEIEEGQRIANITSGNFATVIITSEGAAIELRGAKEHEYLPIENITKSSVGFSLFGVLTSKGEVYGKGPYISEKEPDKLQFVWDPVSRNECIIDIVCGVYQLYMLTENGDAYGLGSNSYKQLNSKDADRINTPVLIKNGVKKIFSGNYAYSAFFLTSNNELFACGKNADGTLGINSESNQLFMTKVDYVPDGTIENIVTGFQHSIMLIRQKNGLGQVYTCGYADYNGLGEENETRIFRQIKFFENENVIQIDVGCFHTMILTESNKLFMFGLNSDGQLGTGISGKKTAPCQIIIPQLSDCLSNYTVCAGSFNSFLYYSPNSNLCSDLLEFFHNGEGCDIELTTRNGKISAHKNILKYRLKEKNLQRFQNLLLQKSTNEANEIMEFIYGGNQLRSDLFNQLMQIKCFGDRNLTFQVTEAMTKMSLDDSTKDFVIKTQNKNFRVHKTILWARSQLFRGMFVSVQDSTNEVTDYSRISDLAFEIFIQYLYTDEINPSFNSQINEKNF